jgi:hypothetical protein
MYLDQMSFPSEGRQLFPKLYFTESDLEPDGGIMPPKVVHTGGANPPPYCEYAIGTISHFFDELKQ